MMAMKLLLKNLKDDLMVLGNLDLEVVLDWLYEVDKLFDTMVVPEEDQVKIIAYKLCGGVGAWWFLPSDVEQVFYQEYHTCWKRTVVEYTSELLRLQARCNLKESEEETDAKYITMKVERSMYKRALNFEETFDEKLNSTKSHLNSFVQTHDGFFKSQQSIYGLGHMDLRPGSKFRLQRAAGMTEYILSKEDVGSRWAFSYYPINLDDAAAKLDKLPTMSKHMEIITRTTYIWGCRSLGNSHPATNAPDIITKSVTPNLLLQICSLDVAVQDGAKQNPSVNVWLEDSMGSSSYSGVKFASAWRSGFHLLLVADNFNQVAKQACWRGVRYSCPLEVSGHRENLSRRGASFLVHKSRGSTHVNGVKHLTRRAKTQKNEKGQ
ncbi:hypothetical protein Tco_0135043 [Tanacetum coccineum]